MKVLRGYLNSPYLSFTYDHSMTSSNLECSKQLEYKKYKLKQSSFWCKNWLWSSCFNAFLTQTNFFVDSGRIQAQKVRVLCVIFSRKVTSRLSVSTRLHIYAILYAKYLYNPNILSLWLKITAIRCL